MVILRHLVQYGTGGMCTYIGYLYKDSTAGYALCIIDRNAPNVLFLATYDLYLMISFDKRQLTLVHAHEGFL